MLRKWQKGVVSWIDGEHCNISVVFTWDIDKAIELAEKRIEEGFKVRIGGPGTFTMHKVLQQSGIKFDSIGGDVFEAVTFHNPDATFASRGCPVNCWFCIVPAMEGKAFSMIDNFTPRPILCDNNLSALPDDFQIHIVARYMRSDVPLLDANSGFEPKTFTPDVYNRWNHVNKGPWRFALDEQGERQDVERVMKMLCAVSPKRKRVYVLIGNEPFADCMDRINSVIGWGGEPHCQPLMKLNARKKEPWVKHDWTASKLKDVARWANRRLWKYTSLKGYLEQVEFKRAIA